MTARYALRLLAVFAAALLSACATSSVPASRAPDTPAATVPALRGTNDLGVVIERASGSVLIVEHSTNSVLGRVEGLGDLSHAAAVFSRDGRHAYVFGRDGGLNRIDLLTQTLTGRILQSGNAIGGSISQDGRIVAVQNYTPGGIKLFDAGSLELLADIPTADRPGEAGSKVVGLADLPGNRFGAALFEAGAIWIVDATDPRAPVVTKHEHIGRQPYDGLASLNGRYYIAGLYGEDGLALLDLWQPEKGVQRILGGYGRGNEPLPVFKMPHLRGWAISGDRAFFPAIGRHAVLVADVRDWREVAQVPVAGQPVFAIASPDGRQVWVNFAFPDNDTVQVIDVPTLSVRKTMKPCPGVLHFEFEPRGEEVWLSCRDAARIEIWDTRTLEKKGELPAQSPSGIFFTSRAGRLGL